MDNIKEYFKKKLKCSNDEELNKKIEILVMWVIECNKQGFVIEGIRKGLISDEVAEFPIEMEVE